MLDITRYIQKFDLPQGFLPPEHLVYEDIEARPLTRQDVDADLEAVNSSIETIRKTRGGSWPEQQVDKEFDFLDLVWHEREFRERGSFAYVVYDKAGVYLGCFYLYPMGIRTGLSDDAIYDVDASWWVSSTAYEQGYYEKLYAGLQQWLGDSFPFEHVYYSNKLIPS